MFSIHFFLLQTCNDFPLTNEAKKPTLTLTLGPDEVSFFDFVKEGWRRQKEKHIREKKLFLVPNTQCIC